MRACVFSSVGEGYLWHRMYDTLHPVPYHTRHVPGASKFRITFWSHMSSSNGMAGLLAEEALGSFTQSDN